MGKGYYIGGRNVKIVPGACRGSRRASVITPNEQHLYELVRDYEVPRKSEKD